MSSSLRKVATDDLERLTKLEIKIQKAPWNRAQFEAELEKPHAHVLLMTDDETDEEIHGYIVFWTLAAELYILNVGVDPELRRKGIGRLLVQAALREGIRSECRVAVLEVRKSNESALQLYQRIGFRIGNVRKEFYSDGEDAYQLSVSLDGNDPYFQMLDFDA